MLIVLHCTVHTHTHNKTKWKLWLNSLLENYILPCELYVYVGQWWNANTNQTIFKMKKNWNMTYIHRFPFHNFVSFVCCAITRYLLPWASRGSEESVAESVLVTTTNTFLANYRANFRLFMMLGITKCIHGWNKRI